MNHSNGQAPNNQDFYDEQGRPVKQVPEPKFRGVWVPPELFERFYDGDLNSPGFVLSLVIESLVQSRGQGCWASDAYLAKHLGTTARQVRRVIKTLLKNGIIKRTKGTRRTLKTFWSDAGESDDAQGGSTPIGVDPLTPRKGADILVQNERTRMSADKDNKDKYYRGAADRRNADAASSADPGFGNEESLTNGHISSPPKGAPPPPPPKGKSSSPTTGAAAMPFTVNQIGQPSHQGMDITEEDRRRAALLRAHVRRNKWACSISRKKWAAQFGALRRSGVEESEVDRVLNHLVAKNLKKPKITDGEQFRERFEWLRGLTDAEAPAVAVSDDAERIVRRLTWMWPERLKEQLPAVVQVSLDNWRRFVGRCREIGEAGRTGPRLKGVNRDHHAPRPGTTAALAEAVSRGVHDPTHFVFLWWDDVGRWVCDPQAGFRGSLTSLTLDPAADRFRNHPYFDECVRSRGGPAVWQQLLQEVGR